MDIQLLIVDDERMIREGIVKAIPWKEYGVTHLWTAADGFEALEILNEHKIQVMITDIRMPEMSGLELAHKAKELQSDIKIAILSGYSDFEYARKAITIGVEDYLLKPIKLEELKKLVTHLTREADEREKQKESEQRAYWRAQIESGMIRKSTCVSQILSDYTRHPLEGKIVCAIVAFDRLDVGQPAIISAAEALKQVIREQEKEYLFHTESRYVAVCCLDMKKSRDKVCIKIQQMLSQWNRKAKEKEIATLSAAISNPASLYKLFEVQTETERYLNRRLYMGAEVLIDGAQYQPEYDKEVFIVKDEDLLGRYVTGLQKEKACRLIQLRFEEMKKAKLTSYDIVRGICHNLLTLLVRNLQSIGVDVKSLQTEQGGPLRIPDLITLQQYSEWMQNRYAEILSQVADSGENRNTPAVIAALSYISANYRNEINRDLVAEHVHLSGNYFSYVFKKEMNQSFSEYLNRYRVKKAKVLLDTTSMLTGEVAREVGFLEESYFSSVFKKVTGFSPSVYRKRGGKE